MDDLAEARYEQETLRQTEHMMHQPAGTMVTPRHQDLPLVSVFSPKAVFWVTFLMNVLGGFIQKIFLIFVCVSIFACGLVIMVTNGRLIWSMSRDRRLPGYQLWRQVPSATGGPTCFGAQRPPYGGVCSGPSRPGLTRSRKSASGAVLQPISKSNRSAGRRFMGAGL